MIQGAARAWALITGQALALFSFAQTAFRVDLFQNQPVFEDRKIESCYGLGLDFAITERTSVGVDAIGAWTSLSSLSLSKTHSAAYNGYEVDYARSQSLYGLLAHSDYCLSDNDRTHLYLGPSFGLLLVGAQIQIQGIYRDYGYHTPSDLGLQENARDKTVLIPLGIRVGLRGAFDAQHMDLYLGIGTHLGESYLAPSPFLGKGIPLASGYFQFGLAWAVG